MQNLFAHTISRIDFIDGMVRVELALATAKKEGAQEPGVDPVYSLHMPLGGFMRAALVQESFIRELVQRGILPAPDAAAGGGAAAAKQAAKTASSPNFR